MTCSSVFCSTHSVPVFPGLGTRFGMYWFPGGNWSMNFPPVAVLPPFGAPADLLWVAEELMLALEPSVFFSVCAVDELLLLLLLLLLPSVVCAVSNSVRTLFR